MTSLGSDDGIRYPRWSKRNLDERVPEQLPSMDMMEEAVVRAMRDAENELTSLGNVIVI